MVSGFPAHPQKILVFTILTPKSWSVFDTLFSQVQDRYRLMCGKQSVEGARLSGALEVFVQKISAEASTLTDDDIAELHRAHYTDDQIFEAIVSAAVGAGLFRLESVLNLLQR